MDRKSNRITGGSMKEGVFRSSLDPMADWVRGWGWKYWITLTFSHDLAPADASALLTEYLQIIERTHHDDVSCIIGSEQKAWSGSGKPAGRVHFHLLLAGPPSLSARFMKDLWELPQFGGSRTSGASADVKVYDPKGGAINYLLKLGKEDRGWDWNEWRLELLSPRLPDSACRTSASRRKYRRKLERSLSPQNPDSQQLNNLLAVLPPAPLPLKRISPDGKETRKLGCRS